MNNFKLDRYVRNRLHAYSEMETYSPISWIKNKWEQHKKDKVEYNEIDNKARDILDSISAELSSKTIQLDDYFYGAYYKSNDRTYASTYTPGIGEETYPLYTASDLLNYDPKVVDTGFMIHLVFNCPSTKYEMDIDLYFKPKKASDFGKILKVMTGIMNNLDLNYYSPTTYSRMNTYSIKDWFVGIKNNTKATLNKMVDWIRNNKTVTASIVALAGLCILVSTKYNQATLELVEDDKEISKLRADKFHLEATASDNADAAKDWKRISDELLNCMSDYTSVNAHNKDNPALAQRVEFITEQIAGCNMYAQKPEMQNILSAMAKLVEDGDFSRNRTRIVDHMLNEFSSHHLCGRQFVDDWGA